MARTLHIVDPGFYRAIGHHRSVNELLSRTALAQGDAVRVLAPESCPDPGWCDVELVRAFDKAVPYVLFQSALSRLQGASVATDQMLGQLQKWLTPYVHAGDVVLVHTGRFVTVSALLAWAAGSALAGRITLRLFFQGPLSRDPTPSQRELGQAFFKVALDEFVPALAAGLDLVADNQPLVDHLTTSLGHSFRYEPPPIDFSQAPRDDTPPPAEAPVLGHLGDLRGEKRGQMAVQAMAHVLGQHATARGLVHDPGDRLDEDALPAAIRDRLSVVKTTLAPGDFYRLMQQATVILIPYDPEAYALRSSHTVVEAIGLARPVVVSDGTWMAAFLRQFDPMPGAVMPSYTEAGLIDAIQSVFDTLPAKLAAARQAAEQVRRRHDAGVVAQRLIAPMPERPR